MLNQEELCIDRKAEHQHGNADPGDLTGIGQGNAAGQAAAAVGRQPEAKGDVMQMMILGQAIAETSAIYGFVVAIILLFINPLVSSL